MSQNNLVYRFGEFRLDASRRLLFKDEESVFLPPKATEILLFLIENKGRLVEKKELMQKIWQDSFVEDNNLTVNITIIRKALGEKSGDNKFILTVPRRGYQFVADTYEETYSEETDISQTFLPEIEKRNDFLINHNPNQIRQIKLNRKPLIVSAVILLIIFSSGFIYWNFASRKIENPSQIKTLAICLLSRW